jgi:hypothetical protein
MSFRSIHKSQIKKRLSYDPGNVRYRRTTEEETYFNVNVRCRHLTWSNGLKTILDRHNTHTEIKIETYFVLSFIYTLHLSHLTSLLHATVTKSYTPLTTTLTTAANITCSGWRDVGRTMIRSPTHNRTISRQRGSARGIHHMLQVPKIFMVPYPKFHYRPFAVTHVLRLD